MNVIAVLEGDLVACIPEVGAVLDQLRERL